MVDDDNLPAENPVQRLTKDLGPLYTEKQVAEYLRVCPKTVARERRAGKIHCIMVKKRPRYHARHVEQYLERQEEPAKEPDRSEANAEMKPSAMPRADKLEVLDGPTALRLARETFFTEGKRASKRKS